MKILFGMLIGAAVSAVTWGSALKTVKYDRDDWHQAADLFKGMYDTEKTRADVAVAECQAIHKNLNQESLGQFLFYDLNDKGEVVDHKFGKRLFWIEIGREVILPDWVDMPRVENITSDKFEGLWLQRDPRVWKPVLSTKALFKIKADMKLEEKRP